MVSDCVSTCKLHSANRRSHTTQLCINAMSYAEYNYTMLKFDHFYLAPAVSLRYDCLGR